MSDNWKHVWFSSPASVIAIIVVLLNVMGFLTVQTFILRMCLPTNFFENTPIDYLQWGVKAVVGLVVFIVIVTLAVAIVAVIGAMLSFFFRLTVFRIKFVKYLLDRLVRGARTWIQGMSAARLTGILFMMSFAVFVVFGWTQAPVIQEFTKAPSPSEQFDAPTVFASSNQASLTKYQFASAALILTLGLLLFFSIKAGSKQNKSESLSPRKHIISIIFTCATGSLLLFALAYWARPYRLISHNEFEVVRYNHLPAFVISEKDPRLFLYVPGERPFIIEKNDTLLDRTGKRYYKNIFDKPEKNDTLLDSIAKRHNNNIIK